MNSPQNVILSIDEGTSGTRAAVVGQDGQVHCLEYHPLRVVSPRHGVVEQDANEILTMTLAVCRKTIAEAQSRNMHIQALAIATQRSTAVLWDRQSGQALVPAMVWQDARYARTLADKAGEWDRPLLNHTGRPVGIRSPYLWAARHIADTPAIAAAHRAGRLMFGTIDSWLLWHLTEERRCLSTPTNATSAGAYQLRDHRYYARGWRNWLSRADCYRPWSMMVRCSAPRENRCSASLCRYWPAWAISLPAPSGWAASPAVNPCVCTAPAVLSICWLATGSRHCTRPVKARW